MPQFGFSVGDLIRGVELIVEAVHSLNETKGARAEYSKFIHELACLQKALEQIRSLCPDITDSASFLNIKNTVTECSDCIEDFMSNNNRFKVLESVSPVPWTLSGWRTRGRMMRWAICKKADIAKFRGEVHRHIQNIQLLQGSKIM